MALKIFISYRRRNGEFYAHLLYEILKQHKYDVFLDKQSLNQGRFDEQILRQIEKSDYFLLLLTKDAFNRINDPQDWMRREIEHALKLNKKIIPIIDEQFNYPAFLPDSFKDLPTYQGIETDMNEDHTGYVVQQLEKYFRRNRNWTKYIPIRLLAMVLVSIGLLFAATGSPPEVVDPPQPPVTDNDGKNTGITPPEKPEPESEPPKPPKPKENPPINGSNNKFYGNDNTITGSNNKAYGSGNNFVSGSNNKEYSS